MVVSFLSARFFLLTGFLEGFVQVFLAHGLWTILVAMFFVFVDLFLEHTCSEAETFLYRFHCTSYPDQETIGNQWFPVPTNPPSWTGTCCGPLIFGFVILSSQWAKSLAIAAGMSPGFILQWIHKVMRIKLQNPRFLIAVPHWFSDWGQVDEEINGKMAEQDWHWEQGTFLVRGMLLEM